MKPAERVRLGLRRRARKSPVAGSEEEKSVRLLQNSLVLERLLTEVQPQARDRLVRGSASKTLQDSPQSFPLSSTCQQSARALFARVYPVVARPLNPVRHVQEPNHVALATRAYKEVLSTQVFQTPAPLRVGHHNGCM